MDLELQLVGRCADTERQPGCLTYARGPSHGRDPPKITDFLFQEISKNIIKSRDSSDESG